MASVLEKKLDGAREVVAALERALQTRRLYEPDHTLYVEATQDLLNRAKRFFSEFGYLRIDVRDDGLLFEQNFLLQSAKHETQIPLRLYKDGIRQLRMRQGLTDNEMLSFLALFETSAKEFHEMGEDMVSVIWNRDFKNIDIAVVDEFDTEESDIALTARQTEEAEEVIRNLSKISEALTRTAPMTSAPKPFDDAGELIEDPPPPDRMELPDEELQTIFTEDQEHVCVGLWEQIEYETLAGAVRRSLAVIVELFENADEDALRQVSPLLIWVTRLYLRRKELGPLGHFLADAEDAGLLDTGDEENVWKDLKAEIDITLRPPVWLACLNDSFKGDYEGVSKLLPYLDRMHVGRIMSIYGQVRDEMLRELLRGFLIERREHITLELCKDLLMACTDYVEEAIKIVEEASPEGLLGVLSSSYERMKAEDKGIALFCIVRLKDPDRVPVIRKALSNPDASVRSAAYRAVADSKDWAFRDMMLGLVKSRAFVQSDSWEKVLALRALAFCSGATQFTLMRQMAEKKPPLFNRAKHEETRRAAILALADLGTEQAIAYVKKGTESKDLDLRKYCKEALAKREAQDSG